MHHQDRQVELPLQRAKVCQQLSHLAGMVLVGAVKSHQGIQNEQPGSEPPGCLQEPRAIPIAVEPEHGRGDHVDLHLGETQTAMLRDSLDALAHNRQRVLGQVDQDRPRLRHGVLSQAHRAVATLKAMSSPSMSSRTLGRHRSHRPILHSRALPQASAECSPRWESLPHARREALDSDSPASSDLHFLPGHGERESF